jgi:hypothetical protein
MVVEFCMAHARSMAELQFEFLQIEEPFALLPVFAS